MIQTNFELAVEVINQAIFELLPIEDSAHNETRQAVDNLVSCAEDGYILVQWIAVKLSHIIIIIIPFFKIIDYLLALNISNS